MCVRFRLAFAVTAAVLSASVPAQVITTVAGGGSLVGDGAPATTAALDYPQGIAVDVRGLVHIADTADRLVRRIAANGTIQLEAGAGTDTSGPTGINGDGGAAIVATLGSPHGICFAPDGSMYIADSPFNRIRRVSPSGIITTVAGNGSYAHAGDGGVATSASLQYPMGVVVDAGGVLYVSEENYIRRIGTDGTISTIAGGGNVAVTGDAVATTVALNRPIGLALDSSGNLYVAETRGHRILRLDAQGVIHRIAGDGLPDYSGDGGAAAAARLSSPQGVAIESTGALAIADTGNHVIRRVTSDGRISTIAGTGSQRFAGDGGQALEASFMFPQSIVADATGNLYVADIGDASDDPPIGRRINDSRIRKIVRDGTITTIAGNGTNYYLGENVDANTAAFYLPGKIVFDKSGSLLIADIGNNVVRKITPDYKIVTIIGDPLSGGDYYGDGGSAAKAGLNGPVGLRVSKGGEIYVADADNNVIRKVDASGIISTFAGSGRLGYSGDGGNSRDAKLTSPFDVDIDSEGNVFIADASNNVVREVLPDGTIRAFAGTGKGACALSCYPGDGGYSGDGGPAIAAELNDVVGITLSASGEAFIVDGYNHAIRKVAKDGAISTVAGDGTAGYAGDGGPATKARLHFPTSIAFDAQGQMFIADSGNNVIREVMLDGSIRTVAGDGQCGYSGDGGPATYAELCFPYGISVDANGDVYVADTENNVVRKIFMSVVTAQMNLDQRGLTGAWYAPSTSGQGLLLEVYHDIAGIGQGYMAAGWYTFDVTASGGQRWYTLQGPAVRGQTAATLDIYSSVGGNFNAKPAVTAVKVGTALLSFQSCAAAVLDFAFADGRSGTISLKRADPSLICSPTGVAGAVPHDYLQSGAWYNHLVGGQGFFFEINPSINLLFAGWYTYLPNGAQGGAGAQRWYTLQDNDFVPGTASKTGIPIYETTGGVFNQGHASASTPVGTVDLTITSCESMTLTYHFTSGSNVGQVGTILLSRVAAVPDGCE